MFKLEKYFYRKENEYKNTRLKNWLSWEFLDLD